MKILVTGAKGFVGRNLVEALKCIQDGRDQVHREIAMMPGIHGTRDGSGTDGAGSLMIYEYDADNTEEELDSFCRDCDFVFHFAGVNRPRDAGEYMKGNYGFSEILLDTLEKHGNTCPVMLSSSIQASLEGRFRDSAYGESKLAGEKLFYEYGEKTGAKVLVYRFPNLFGKWCRPNYNSVIATFCHNIANGLPVRVDDAETQLELVYIDDLLEEMFAALQGREHRAGEFCYVPQTHKARLGEIVKLLQQFHDEPITHWMPEIPAGSFAKKLYSTYLSYLPGEKTKVEFTTNADERGSFTEIIKTAAGGQFSVNVNKPGKVKGEHWHHSKWEIFIVVSGHGLIQERRIGTDEVIEHEVYGTKPEAVYLLPGYVHNLINLSESEDLVTLIWANEEFDPARPDTYRAYVNCREPGTPGEMAKTAEKS